MFQRFRNTTKSKRDSIKTKTVIISHTISIDSMKSRQFSQITSQTSHRLFAGLRWRLSIKADDKCFYERTKDASRQFILKMHNFLHIFAGCCPVIFLHNSFCTLLHMPMPNGGFRIPTWRRRMQTDLIRTFQSRFENNIFINSNNEIGSVCFEKKKYVKKLIC